MWSVQAVSVSSPPCYSLIKARSAERPLQKQTLAFHWKKPEGTRPCGGAVQDLMGELLSPCRCSGSVRCTHEPCLIKWISERGSWSCELCYYKYQVIAISTKNPLQWQAISLTVIEKVQIAAAVLGSLFLIASISWLVWSSLSPSAKWQRQDLLFQICYAMYGFMDLVCIALIVHEGPSVFRIFNRWQAVNQQWKVLNYDKLKDTEDPQKGGASSTLRSFTLPLSHRVGASTSPPNGSGPSPSTSSLMGVTTATATPGTAIPLPPVAPETEESSEAENGPASLAEHHCAYNLLQLLSQHLRPQEPRPPPAAVAAPAGQAANGNRELVMRVTTV
ncbi:E3 ubiquitin-protein ligase MARCHF4 isoform X2 [Astyanax mexicanus]|uniref:E3 ubiquitin-protein ligase MARCHF4 isoform X2 n=1 Tax=Astyanax mexicanus TaxID=7994 RepID=UPI0020CB1278|nr:E3 ubiquitin-protein ligase MARCHF4 isoform X2 [Astyanax mexicanus]